MLCSGRALCAGTSQASASAELNIVPQKAAMSAFSSCHELNLHISLRETPHLFLQWVIQVGGDWWRIRPNPSSRPLALLLLLECPLLGRDQELQIFT